MGQLFPALGRTHTHEGLGNRGWIPHKTEFCSPLLLTHLPLTAVPRSLKLNYPLHTRAPNHQTGIFSSNVHINLIREYFQMLCFALCRLRLLQHTHINIWSHLRVRTLQSSPPGASKQETCFSFSLTLIYIEENHLFISHRLPTKLFTNFLICLSFSVRAECEFLS